MLVVYSTLWVGYGVVSSTEMVRYELGEKVGACRVALFRDVAGEGWETFWIRRRLVERHRL